jgi:hypothetical protein
MTGGISIGPKGMGPILLDGANYGQGRCKTIEQDKLQRMEADARLIAAAPDLLEILQLLVRSHGGTVAAAADHELSIKARVAIAKATKEKE